MGEVVALQAQQEAEEARTLAMQYERENERNADRIRELQEKIDELELGQGVC